MFARFFAVASLAAFAAATPLALRNDGQCNTGNIKCCQSSTTASEYNSSPEALIYGLVDVTGDTELFLTCSPISLVGGDTCTQQPVCCEGNQYNGLVNIGCSPINL